MAQAYSGIQQFRLLAVALFLAGVGGLVYLGQTASLAGQKPFAPAVAAFKNKDKLRVAVTLTGKQTGDLRVDLIDGQGQTIAKATKPVTAGSTAVGFDFPFTNAVDPTIRVTFDGKQHEVALNKVSLVKAHETTLTSGQEFYAGSQSSLRCLVQGVRTITENVPLAGSDVSVVLRDKDTRHELGKGKTNKDGIADLSLAIPEMAAGQYTLEVVTRSVLGQEKLERPVRIKADAKILLVSDRPIYQPGQLMHLRALVLRPFDMKPVQDKDLLFEVEDSKGNKVFKRTFKTSEYGVAAVDFQLADEVNMGDYHLRAILGDRRAEKTVNVKRYVLPRFKTDVTADKSFYLPKEKIQASIQSDYFFGKPVANSKIHVEASTFDVQFRKFQTWEGKTDANGHAKFEIQLPDYFVGLPLKKGNALVKLDVKVTDTADHAETVTRTYTVSDQPIKVSLIPEGGKLVPGMENRVFAAAIYPDGSPAVCDVALWLGKEAKGEPLATVKTNAAGLAEFRFTPTEKQFRQGNFGQRDIEMLGGKQQGWGPAILLDVRAEAKDDKGNKAVAVAELNSQPLGENVLVRLDKAIYQGGDSLNVDVHTSAGLPTVFVDIIRGGQVMLSRWLEVKDGRASQRVDLPQSVFGSLEVHAYQMLASGEIIRDSRVIYVQPRNDLKVEVKPDQSVYAPGQDGRIRFQVTDQKGNPAQAAIGVVIVDEAVYALQEMQPGLEKVYFTLQEEMMKPQVEIHVSGGTIGNLVRQPVLPAPRQQVAQVLLTAVKLPPPARWDVNPGLARKQQLENQVANIGQVIWNFAWNQPDRYLVEDKKSGRLAFKEGLLDELAKTNQLPAGWLNGPLGGKLTLADLQNLEPAFTVDNLARAITLQRLYQLHWSVFHYTNGRKNDYVKDGKWTLPDGIVVEAAKKQGLDGRWLKDAWGELFRLERQEKKRDNTIGQPQFDYCEIVSAGPDRKFGTRDDVHLTNWNDFQYGWIGSWWWLLEDSRAAARKQKMQMLGRRHLARRGLMANQMQFGAMRLAGAGGMPVPMAAAKGAMLMDDAKGQAEYRKADGKPGAAPAVKIREYFPETMLWLPALITNEQGIADLAVNFADSITTWRMTASASSKAGALGGAQIPLKVFQDFFVDVDLPVSLTQGDEVSFPVPVFNYLKTPQKIKLELKAEPWFELLDGALTREIELAPNEVTSIKYRIRAGKIGFQPLTVKAFGSKKSDAVKRVVEVVPNGQKIEKVASDRLTGNVTQTIDIPQNAVPDASKLIVRIYPGVMAQVMEGVDGILRMPGGCFEQTSSSAYPNVLVVDYIKKARITSPQILMKAEQYLNAGYQRLLTFERPGGGFDWWGREAPLVWLSAYGLQEFSDMAKVYPIDRGIIDRTQNFLLKNMDKDGTWSNIGATHSETIASMGNPKMLLTSYVAWSLLESGLPKDRLKTSIDYLRSHINDAGDNAYILALAANALAAYDAKDDSTLEAVRRLDKLRKDLPEWKAVSYPARTTALTYARGDAVTIETTALAALAMIKTGQFTTSANQALTYLIKAKQGNGHWGTTSGTILSLKALIAGMGGVQIKGTIPFTILVDGKEAARGKVSEDNSDVMQTFDLREFAHTGANKVQIDVQGESSLMYQIVGRYYEPWRKDQHAKAPIVDIDVQYDRTKLSTKDLLRAKATLKYHGKVPTYMVMLDLGIPPGFTIDAGDFAEMVGKKQIKKFSVTARQVIVYLGDVRPGDVLTFEYALKPKYPVHARTPAAVAYEYYTPANRAVSRPVELMVEEQK